MPASQIQFEIAVKSLHAHVYSVSCSIQNAEHSELTFSMPSWTPGSYLIRDFAQHVLSMQAFASDTPVELVKIDKDTWRCLSVEPEIRIEYEVYAFDSSIRAAFIDDSYAFFSGTSVFVRIHGFEQAPHSLIIQSHAIEYFRVATSMTATLVDERGFGAYLCNDYDELVDHPVLMSNFLPLTFEASGVTHRLIITPALAFNAPRLLSDCQRICEEHIALFGAPPPFKDYYFLLRVEDEGYGGLEHRASSALVCKIADLPHQTKISDGYRTLLGLISHEYFHAWNVKRLKPASFLSYDYNGENYTELLWFFEGFTSYYDDLALVRSGAIEVDSYLELVSKTLTRVQAGQGRLKQSLGEASFDAWVKFYKPNENSHNANVSYYLKGSLVALALDLTIRQQTKSSLDDVMRSLWQRFTQNGCGVTEEMIVDAASVAAKTDMRAFFDNYVHSTTEISLEELLAGFGLEMSWVKQGPYLGCYVKRDGDACKVTHVDENSPAMQAGICALDTLIAVNDWRITGANLEAQLLRYAAGETVKVHAFRRGHLREFSVVISEQPQGNCVIKRSEHATAEQQAALAAWVSTNRI